MELPVITTSALGCVDSVLDNETGYVVPVKYTGAMVDKMEKLYADAPLRAALGRSGRAFVLRTFDPAGVRAASRGDGAAAVRKEQRVSAQADGNSQLGAHYAVPFVFQPDRTLQAGRFRGVLYFVGGRRMDFRAGR